MVLRLWFEGVRAMFFLFILLDALPVPMLRQVYLDFQNRAPMQVKLTFSENARFFDFSCFPKTTFYLHGSSIFVFLMFCCVFAFFVFLGGTSKIAVLLA